jgi:activating signal cointegrator complex subunit 3
MGFGISNMTLPQGTTRNWVNHVSILEEYKKGTGGNNKKTAQDSTASASGGKGSSNNNNNNNNGKGNSSVATAGGAALSSKSGEPEKKAPSTRPPARYELVHVPPKRRLQPAAADQLVSVESSLSNVAQQAFRGIKTLNRLQSAVYQTAYKSNNNMLVCAPTGAGKTNIAMLTVVRKIEEFIDQREEMKVIYVAPMKALAQEVVATFSKRLESLKIKVRELTGDMQLTRTEIDQTQLIVTTPEKWDVITRKTGEGTLVERVSLLIIDEVHLVGEDRGPVIESLVARTLRLVEQKQRMVRIVGLSATLPNYRDVAFFLRVDPDKGMFFFDNSYRPVPLDQYFIGINEKDQFRRLELYNELAYEQAWKSVMKDNQVMIFVHSRKDTVKTGRAILECAKVKGHLRCFVPKSSSSSAAASTTATAANDPVRYYAGLVAQSKNAELRELFEMGIGCHHAGMLREDRTLTEKMFTAKAINVLICTATLAWGVNLPAHTVIIKGTQVYQPERGGLTELSMQDVFQCFGRAGRPQFDTSGEAVLITEHEQLNRYLGMLNHALPLESRLIKSLPDALNAEIVAGTVTNLEEGSEWLSYTFLHVRMMRNPTAYGVGYDEKDSDPSLSKRRLELITQASQVLDQARMARYGGPTNRSGTLRDEIQAETYKKYPLGVTYLGRVA